MPDKFDNLIADLRYIRTNERRPCMFGEDAHDYELYPVLPEGEVFHFEAQHKVQLPEDYRQFLTRVGNGGAGPYYGLFKLGEMDHGHEQGSWGDFIGQLSAPFPHTSAWNDLTGLPDVNHSEDDDYDALLDTFERRYFDTQWVNGAIPICHLGCALRQLLITTGPESDNIWQDDRADYGGLRPLENAGRSRVTFFDWYRSWLNEALSKLRSMPVGAKGPWWNFLRRE